MGKKNSTFKNIMVTLGCTVFAGVYALGGGYAAYKLLGDSTQPAWLDRVEIRVDEKDAGSGVTEASNNHLFDFGRVPQKPRFEEKEEETETTDEEETEELDTESALETETASETEEDSEEESEEESESDLASEEEESEEESESDSKTKKPDKKKKPVEVDPKKK